jgi:hypothetical protein
MLKLEKEILIYKYNTPLIILSDPIYHKNERYLVFVSYQNTTDLGDFESLVVVLTKIKKKEHWLIELVNSGVIKSRLR